MTDNTHEEQENNNVDIKQETEQMDSEVEQETEAYVETKEEETGDVKHKAKSTGHLTQEEYLAKHGSLKGYKTEEEFVRTGDMIEQIMSLKKKLDQRDSEVEAILTYQKSTIEEHKKKAKQEIEAKLMQAREYGNIEAVEALVKQQTQMDIVDQQENFRQQQNEKQQVVGDFIERNKHWFNDQHPDAVHRASQIDQELTSYYSRIGRSIPLTQLAFEVETQMRREFPDLVNTGVKTRPAVSTTRSVVNKAAVEESDDRAFSKLSQNQKHMYQATKRMLSKQNIQYSIKDFVNQIKNDGEI